MVYNKDNLKIVRTNLKEGDRELVMFLMKHFFQDTPQSLFRFLIAKEAKDVKDIEKKYGSASPKETIAEKVRRVKDMSDEQITNYFYETGVFKDGFLEGAPDVKLSYRIGNDANVSEKVELVKYIQKDPQFPPYENAGRTLDEVLNQAIKEKLI